ncbi:MAG: heparan-alpha-glucosaminide N-acetyltransferase domain-containing protein [Chitinophagaceae bacterium]|nr:heparan-alpha-glucosaminide N-acetyltransferase domain-containing protein [Chitinophagaceae bacterium]
MKRINSIDIVRGFVMVIMALDHTRDLLHVKALTEDPTNLSSTTPALFFTRWITHFCAPSFVFLAGVSVWLSSFKRSVAAQRKFLIKRGLWLILLELVPARILGVAGLLILIFHGLVSLIPAAPGSFTQRSIALLFTGGFRQVTPHTSLIIGYPLIPWLGIILAGYGAGIIFQKEQPLRRIIFLRIGMAATAIRFFGPRRRTSSSRSCHSLTSRNIRHPCCSA